MLDSIQSPIGQELSDAMAFLLSQSQLFQSQLGCVVLSKALLGPRQTKPGETGFPAFRKTLQNPDDGINPVVTMLSYNF